MNEPSKNRFLQKTYHCIHITFHVSCYKHIPWHVQNEQEVFGKSCLIVSYYSGGSENTHASFHNYIDKSVFLFLDTIIYDNARR